jgi:hypothetical protein
LRHKSPPTVPPTTSTTHHPHTLLFKQPSQRNLMQYPWFRFIKIQHLPLNITKLSSQISQFAFTTKSKSLAPLSGFVTPLFMLLWSEGRSEEAWDPSNRMLAFTPLSIPSPPTQLPEIQRHSYSVLVTHVTFVLHRPNNQKKALQSTITTTNVNADNRK